MHDKELFQGFRITNRIQNGKLFWTLLDFDRITRYSHICFLLYFSKSPFPMKNLHYWACGIKSIFVSTSNSNKSFGWYLVFFQF